ncbi:MAG TPA: response regulator [Tepidisphaeraceae bacterium]|jgi:two-component system catabolic regulation response regulator CreB|nr:response regulator [Tepidisphaeraceae bacterium]
MCGQERTALRVLVVDDNQFVTQSLFSLLRSEGFDPIVFQSAQPALEFIRGNCPDIALIDLHLPDLSGLELSRELRQTHGDGLPIIIFSGDSSLETLKALSGVGATFFMAKPVNAPHLMECIKQWTGPAKVPPT